jgi:hypothetical protein
MNPQLLPATAPEDVPAWQQTVVAFLAEKERRSGSRRTVDTYARMLWPFLTRVGSPDLVTPAHVLARAHGIGLSGREPSSTTVGARIACLSSYFRFLIRMNVAALQPVRRPRAPKDGSHRAEARRDCGLPALLANPLGRVGSRRPPGTHHGDLRAARRAGLPATRIRADGRRDRPRTGRCVAACSRAQEPDR